MAPTVTHQANVRGGTARGADAQTEQAATAKISNTGEDFLMTSAPLQMELLGDDAATPADQDEGASLDEVWPVVAAALRRSLLRYGVDPFDADDIVQNVALRAIRKRVPIVSARVFGKWAHTVAIRQAADVRRNRARSRETLDSTPVEQHTPDPRETESRAEARLACRAVFAEAASLRSRERAALAGLLSPDDRTDVDPNVQAQRVFRLRAKLGRAVRRAVGVFVPPFAWAHRKGATAAPELVVAVSWAVPMLVATALAQASPEAARVAESASWVTTAEPASTAASQSTSYKAASAALAPLPTPLARPAAPSAPPPTPTPTSTRLDVAGPGGTGVFVDKHPSPDNRLICVHNAPNHGDEHCVDKPPLPIPKPTGNATGNVAAAHPDAL